MKKIIFLTISLTMTFAIGGICKSQSNTENKFMCHVVKVGKTYDAEQLKIAIEKADWCGFIHKTKNYSLMFDDGSIVELYSQKSHFANGITLSDACIQSETTTDNSVYSILSSGTIARKVQKDKNIKTNTPR